LYEYTLMPTHIHAPFSVQELADIQLAEPFTFTKGCRTLRVPGRMPLNPQDFGTLLFDVENDPQQQEPLDNPEIVRMMVDHLLRLMKQVDSPAEQYERLGLHQP
jgi:hypothetical protein